MPTYTGAGLAYPPPVHGAQGFCHSCCHPASNCCCHRECRKESRELLVQPTLSRGDLLKDPANAATFARAAVFRGRQQLAPIGGVGAEIGQQIDDTAKLGVGSAFIGGACCVYLSIEYVPQTPTTTSLVLVLVDDNEGTVLAWGRTEQPGAGYSIKECIITTRPGADLAVAVVNMTARVRWCEIFSC